MAQPGPQAPDAPVPQPPHALQDPQPPAPPAPQLQHGQHKMNINWLHFKPEFSGKTEKDVEPYLLWTNDRMNAHHFLENIKVKRYCLMLIGEARLWYPSL